MNELFKNKKNRWMFNDDRIIDLINNDKSISYNGKSTFIIGLIKFFNIINISWIVLYTSSLIMFLSLIFKQVFYAMIKRNDFKKIGDFYFFMLSTGSS